MDSILRLKQLPLGTIKEEKLDLKTKPMKELKDEKPDAELAVPDMGQFKHYFQSPQLNQKWGDMVGLSLKSLKDYEKNEKPEKNPSHEGLKPFVIGISGGASAGKRHLVKSMRQTLSSKYNIPHVTYISEENFYKTQENMVPLSPFAYSSSINSIASSNGNKGEGVPGEARVLKDESTIKEKKLTLEKNYDFGWREIV